MNILTNITIKQLKKLNEDLPRKVDELVGHDNYKLDIGLEKEQKELLDFFSKWLNKNYGKRCKTKANGCPCCVAWHMYDLMGIFL